VLVLRVWIDPAAGGALRARITTEGDLTARERISVAAGSAPEIIDVVRSWIEEFVVGGDV
jgi:hypothetical protein